MATPPPSISGLDRYTGPWSSREAAHLLRRTMFGPTLEQINHAATLGLDRCMELLMDDGHLPQEGPINPGKYLNGGGEVAVDDKHIAVGQPWVSKKNGAWEMGTLPEDGEDFVHVQASRNQALRAWKTEQILKEEINIHEKITLFWHNHFAIAAETAQFEFLHIITLMEHALGNFRDLVKLITLDPAMLFFLNGNENTQEAPNENFARELFELYTIGKGAAAAPGDYTHYTEEDIREAAKVLTGWKVNVGALIDYGKAKTELSSNNLCVFFNHQHDSSVKQFSHRFGGATISNNGSTEYKDLIDMIFQQDECARFICRKLYRWFVYYRIDDDIENHIIEPMSEILLEHDYHIKPALEALLTSVHFFEVASFGQMIKNPYDFVMSILKPFGYNQIEFQHPFENFRFHFSVTQLFSLLQMNYFSPPNVAGWKAYYQEPLYYRTWITATSLNFRTQLTKNFALGANDRDAGLNVLKFLEEIPFANDPNKLLDELQKIFFPRDLDDGQRNYLKEILIPGLPDFEWTIEYDQYLANPQDDDLRSSIELKVRKLFSTILSMPEFYLS